MGEDRKALIVAVDDEPGVCRFVKGALESTGRYEVISESVARRGLAVILKRVPDLAILDVLMPEMDGLEILKTVKENAATAHIPVILLTGDDREESVNTAMESYAEMYLSKPVARATLVEKVDFILSSRRIS